MEMFIVAYSGDEINIRSKASDESFCHNQMTDMYEWALSRYPDRKYGDSATYNNQNWGAVMADNAADALKAFLEKNSLMR